MDDREKLIELIESARYWGSNTSAEVAEHLIANGVVIQKQGKWAIDKEDIKWGNSLKRRYCSKCGERPYFDKEEYEFVLTKHCPNCGAKMRGVK